MQPFNITTGDRRKAARTDTAPLSISARPHHETYRVRKFIHRARVSPAYAALVAELIGIGGKEVSMSRTIPPPIAASLQKLIPLLGSDQDGEVIGTVKAITRKLRNAGLDFCDLAENISRAEHHAYADRLPARTWSEMARYCLARAGQLSSTERRFISDMVPLLARGSTPTEKQASWLAGIYLQLEGTR